MKLESVKRNAARILKAGTSRVKIDPSRVDKVKEAITKEDIRGLISEGVIRKAPETGVSAGRARKLKEQKRKGRKQGYGSRKGRFKARAETRRRWIQNVRALRRTLQKMKKEGQVKKDEYGRFYKLIKGNYFKGKKQLEIAVQKGLGEKR
ncbi:MAG: 50S ribosomal protein L19e [Candidatus Diapherotrites archaeon]